MAAMVDPVPGRTREGGAGGQVGAGPEEVGAALGEGGGARPGGDLALLLRSPFSVLLEVADRIETVLASSSPGASDRLWSGPLGWLPDLLVERVVPRLRAEEEVLHPTVGPNSDLTSCRREHDRIRGAIEVVSSLAGRVGAERCPSRSTEQVLRDQLRDLCGLLRDHARAEARLCTPVLEAMGAERREQLERALAESEEAAGRAVRLIMGRAPGETEAVVLRSNPRAGRAFLVGLRQVRSPDRDLGSDRA